MRVLAVTSGRADATPMGPVIKALEAKGCKVRHEDYEGQYLYIAGPVWCGLGEPFSPNIVLLLGDRLEMLEAATAATYGKIPIAHIHGGEASFGSFDNQIRDAITKLAHIHFVAAPEFLNRVVNGLGEGPDRVHVVGAPGLDNLTDLPPRVPEKYFVCTYHPATLEEGSGIHSLIEALGRFPDYKSIWTGVNNDPGSDYIRDALSDCDVRDLDPLEYIGLCRNAAAVVGNSSSGIIEAPTLQVPTVNVGSRQDGRLKGPSIIDAPSDDIDAAIRLALDYDGAFDNPYGGPGASQKIADILATTEIRMRKEW